MHAKNTWKLWLIVSVIPPNVEVQTLVLCNQQLNTAESIEIGAFTFMQARSVYVTSGTKQNIYNAV